MIEGKILIYRVFDIGPDVSLAKVQNHFEGATSAQRFRLNRSSRAMIINNAPLNLNIETSQYEVNNRLLEMEVFAKIWHFGAISISLQIKIPEGLSWNELIELGSVLESDQTLHNLAVQKTKQVLQQFAPERIAGVAWETFEDYIIYFFKSLPGIEKNAWEVFDLYDVFRLILSESTETLSEQTKKGILEGAFQYGVTDLALIDWNSALVIEPSASIDIPDVIEFALCQLLEMRYYDDVLDEKLNDLYSGLEKTEMSFFKDKYQVVSKEAAQKYLEISETIESVSNSLKVVGDFYLAKIFRAASARFRFKDWQDSVNRKLDNLAEISRLLVSENNEKRSQLLEIIIIVLISIEVMPYLYKIFFE